MPVPPDPSSAVPPAVPYSGRSDRHRGFLTWNRRALASTALVASGALACVPALPAFASTVVQQIELVGLQSFTAPAVLPAQPVSRDDFTVSTFTLVQWPVPASTTMTSGYGYRSCDGCSADHRGIDLTPGSGYPVQAVADGVVVLAEESDAGLGVQVVVEHVIDGSLVRTVYAHLQYGSLAVSTGEAISRGQQLGLVGSTGASTGPHLHFEVLIAGEQIDPLPWLIAHANS